MKTSKVILAKIAFAFLFLTPAFASDTVKGVKSDLATFKKEASVKIEKLEQQIQKLKLKVTEDGNGVRRKTLTELEAARDALKANVEKASDSSGDTWQKFKTNFAESVDSLNSKVQKALKD